MRLIFSIKALTSVTGGAERVLCSLCSELASRGHEVYILTFDKEGGKPFFYLDERVKQIYVGVGDSSKPSGLIDSFIRIILIRKVITKIKPDIVIGFMHSMYILVAFALIASQIKVLGSEHIVINHYKTRPLQFFLLILASKFIKHITVLSEDIQMKYPKCISKKMVVLPNPVELSSGQANLSENKKQYRILSIGRLCEQKDHKTLVIAFSYIAKLYPSWHLKIIGDGPLLEDLDSLVISLGLEDRVSLAGCVIDVGYEYRSADIFVIPSIYEAFGLVTAEAMAHGLPVIGYENCPGTNELITPNINGILIPRNQDRIIGLSTALTNLIDNKFLRTGLGLAARQTVEGRYSIKNVCNCWENLFKLNK
jgi:glycosyltransferase involved in cell wall biosynthesis